MKKISDIVHIRGFAAVSDKGSSRPIQEDAFFCDEKRGVFGIADGYGGNNIGNRAANLCLEKGMEFIRNGLGDSEVTLPFIYRSYYTEAGNLLFNSFLFANGQLINDNRNKTMHTRGGASVLFCYMRNGKLSVANVGVCQVVVVRGNEIIEVLKPKSYRGVIGEGRNSVGADSQHLFDFPLMSLGHYPDLEPEVVEIILQSGDLVFISTDGVFPFLNKEDYCAFTQELPGDDCSLEDWLQKMNKALIAKAVANGSSDNQALISILCA